MKFEQILKTTMKQSRFFTLQFSHVLVTLILFIGLLFSTSLAWAVSPLFLVQENSGNDILLKFDSGVLTTVGNIGFGDVRGIAYDATSDTLFGVARTSNRLITIDPITGTGTLVGPDSYLPSGSNTAEISLNVAGEMFGEGHINNQSAVDTLLSVDKTTGIATTIGNFGVNVLSGLAFDHASGILYGTSYVGELYTIDQTVGTATFVGQITGANGGTVRIAFDQATGILYGITNNEQLVTINLTTLVATEVAQFSIPTQIYSLDFISQARGALLTISPPSGDYVTTQNFDLTLIVEAPGLSVTGGNATFDGSDVTSALVACVIPGTLVSGGQTLRCPDLGGTFGTGTHILDVTLDLSDGSSVSDSVNWEVKENTEP